jgi:hypothetical protein
MRPDIAYKRNGQTFALLEYKVTEAVVRSEFMSARLPMAASQEETNNSLTGHRITMNLSSGAAAMIRTSSLSVSPTNKIFSAPKSTDESNSALYMRSWVSKTLSARAKLPTDDE